MRVKALNSRRSERGVVAPVFAVFLVVLLGIASLVVDYGSLWQNRRQMITATDAAALAAAQEYAEGGDGCAAVAADYYGRNAPGGADAPVCTLGFQQVKVDGSVDVVSAFGAIFGITDQPITSSTTASWEQPSSVTGLRPIGLCLAVLNQLGVPSPPTPGQTVTLPWNATGPDECSNGGNNVPGNWGYIDFGGGNGVDVRNWTETGYPGEVTLPGTFSPFTGAHADVGPVLNNLAGQCITVPVYVKAGGNGNNALFEVIDFASVVVVEAKFNGNPNNRHFTFRFEECVVQGEGGGGGVDYGPRVIRICAVDKAPSNACP